MGSDGRPTAEKMSELTVMGGPKDNQKVLGVASLNLCNFSADNLMSYNYFSLKLNKCEDPEG